MRPRPQQSPLPALAITCGILSLLAAAGLLSEEWEIAHPGTSMHAFFIEAPQAEPQHSIPIPVPSAPPPEIALAWEPALHLSDALPEAMEQPETPPEEPVLPFVIENALPEQTTPAAKAKPHSPPTPVAAQTPLTPPALHTAPPPAYPPALRASRRSGSVRVRIHIDPTGTPTHVDILEDTHPAFAAAAEKCILSGWRFTPARRGSTPVPSTAVQTIHFRL